MRSTETTTAEQDLPLRKQTDFMKLWSGQTISMVGSQITDLALPLIAIYTLHAGASEIGTVNTARWLPFILVALWAGALSDRRRRRPVLIQMDISRALIMGAVAAMALTDVLTVPLLAVAVFVFGACTVLFDVTYNSYVPTIVPQASLLGANARLQATASVAQVGSPGLGGLLVQMVSAPLTLVIDAVTFVVSAVSLMLIRTPEPEPAAAERKQSTIRQIRDGIAVVLGDRLLRALVGTSAIYNLFSQWIFTLFALFAVHDLGMSAGTIGLVVSSGAVGALAGSLVTGVAIKRLGIGAAMIWAVAVECVALLAMPFAPPDHTALMLVVLMGAFSVNGIGVALSSVVATSVRQSVTPRHMLGRMNATYRFVSYGVIAIGAFAGGLAGEAFGSRTGLLMGCIGLLSTIVWVAAGPLRKLKELPAHADAAPSPASAPST